MKIYTKTGDKGQTSLFGGQRVSKNHPRVESYGAVDELNAALGMSRAEPISEDLDSVLEALQAELFTLGADLATPPSVDERCQRILEKDILRLEDWIDQFDAKLPALTRFILPGGNRAGANLHLARTICRRAERLTIGLASEQLDLASSLELPIQYLNRLSDLLFVLARTACDQDPQGSKEVFWEPPPKASAEA